MIHPSTNAKRFDRRRFAVQLLALLCIVVLAVFFTAQVAHHHETAVHNDHCPLCYAAHWAIPVEAALVLVGFFFISATYNAELLSPVFKFWFHDLYNRPPPCQLVLA